MQKAGMDKEAVQTLLPSVGDELMRTPNTEKTWGMANPKPRKCVVEQVNRDHLWYRVRFSDSGLTECYKVPDFCESVEKGVRFK